MTIPYETPEERIKRLTEVKDFIDYQNALRALIHETEVKIQQMLTELEQKTACKSLNISLNQVFIDGKEHVATVEIEVTY